MRKKLALLIITKNSAELLEKCLESAVGLVSEIVAVDSYSQDKTLEILKKHQVKIYKLKEENLGKKRAFGLAKIKNDWILVLDADESLSRDLKNEIVKLLNGSIAEKSGYLIPFQNHFLGRPVSSGGENYKMLRLFHKKSVQIRPLLVHEGFKLKNGIPGELKNKINHYSYRSLRQMFAKFTDYSVREAKQKIDSGEKPSFIKVFSYPLHMFFARYFKDKGYRDGLFRIPLDLGFAYMEMMTYVLLWLYSPRKPK